jgi:hypothetical protein
MNEQSVTGSQNTISTILRDLSINPKEAVASYTWKEGKMGNDIDVIATSA